MVLHDSGNTGSCRSGASSVHAYVKLNSSWTTDGAVKNETADVLEENLDGYLEVIELETIFWAWQGGTQVDGFRNTRMSVFFVTSLVSRRPEGPPLRELGGVPRELNRAGGGDKIQTKPQTMPGDVTGETQGNGPGRKPSFGSFALGTLFRCVSMVSQPRGVKSPYQQ